MTADLLARSALYVPGTRLDLLPKALNGGADQVIIDLEDAVPADAKDVTRHAVSEFLADPVAGPPVWVRVNPGPDGVRDAEAVAGPGLAGLCLAKAEDPGVVALVAEAAAIVANRSVPVEPLVESALAVAACEALAAQPSVVRIQLGEADLAGDVGVAEEWADAGLSYARSRIVFASAAHGLLPPMAPVDPDFRDLERFERGTRRLAGLGFLGRVCIHPAQVAVANRVFTPAASEVDAAQQMIDALHQQGAQGSGVFTGPDGRMVDAATVRSARRVVALADRFGSAAEEVTV